jgi:hypothetical protein
VNPLALRLDQPDVPNASGAVFVEFLEHGIQAILRRADFDGHNGLGSGNRFCGSGSLEHRHVGDPVKVLGQSHPNLGAAIAYIVEMHCQALLGSAVD